MRRRRSIKFSLVGVRVVVDTTFLLLLVGAQVLVSGNVNGNRDGEWVVKL